MMLSGSRMCKVSFESFKIRDREKTKSWSYPIYDDRISLKCIMSAFESKAYYHNFIVAQMQQ